LRLPDQLEARLAFQECPQAGARHAVIVSQDPTGDLSRILYDLTRETTDYIFADSITSLEQEEDCVRATFERGASRILDLVIGADGLHSNVRRLVWATNASFCAWLAGISLAMCRCRTTWA
jgi:2-polyprenyl-6-methoxyphenol hydroxylase-like FAD-dependent oxidoreductase